MVPRQNTWIEPLNEVAESGNSLACGHVPTNPYVL
jgi:hypothetical protein